MILSILSLLFCNTAWAATLPEANLTVSPATGQVAKEFIFDASESKNTAGRRGGLEYRFQFTGGRAWTDWSSKSIAKFIPMDIGTERVRLQVRERNSRAAGATYRTYRVVGDIYRKAWISVRPTKIKAGETAYFELKVSLPRTEDKDKVQARWDFDSDGHFETSYSRQKIVPHIYSLNEVGQVSPTVEVKFEDGTVKRIRGIENLSSKGGASVRKTMLRKTWPKMRITSPEVVAPIVNVSPGKNGYTEDTAFRFDATPSHVPAHAWIEWSFEGGVYIKGQKILVKKFQFPGEHEVRVRTCYNRAAPKCAETILTVNTKEDPLDYRAEMRVTNKTRSASFSSGQDKKSFFKAVVGDTIRFSAQIKQSGGGSGGFTYRWDFEGDGVWDTPFNSRSSIEHVYSRFGSYAPKLQVQNKDLIAFQESVKLQVVPSSAPHGNFTVNKRYIYVGETVRFFPKVTDSQSPRSKIKVRFDVDGDGKWDNRFRNLTSFEWRFSDPGQYIARMQTQDQSGKVVTILRSVTVYPYDKTRPQALVKVSRRYGDTKTRFEFDASDSIGKNLQYVWDFDYRGTNDIISKGARVKTGAAKMTKQFSMPGEKQISLRVIDGDGNENMIHFPVWVSQHVLPANPVNPQDNPTPNSTYENREVPLDSYEKRVSASQWYPGYEPNGVREHPLEVRPDIRVTFRYMKQKKGDISFPDRELSRAGMFYFIYEPYLSGVTFKLQESGNDAIPVFVYGSQRGALLPTKNPFSDVTKNDWFYQPALLSYRDRLSTAPFFQPSLRVSSQDAAAVVRKVTGHKVDFGQTVTREEFRSALGN
jgi:PKD repeat protein